ncbi:unnamed protein product [Camellia sinensis]
MNSKQIKKEESEMEFNFENPFQEQELKPIEWLFETETQFMAAQGFFQNDEARRLRKIAVKKIRQLSQNGGFRHDPFVSFLAVNYYDRCISSYPLPGDEYSYGLFIISCVVIAWKMRKSGFYLPVFLETNRLYNVDYRQIERMEHRILYALKWRMRSVTALCFLDFFISFYNFTDIQEIATFKRQSLECKLLHMHYDARFTEFKPSTIAATALIAERPNIAPPPAFFCEPLLRCQYLNMDELENCHNLLMAQVRSNDLRTYLIPPSPSMDAIAEVEDDDQKRQRSRKRMREQGLV